MIPVDVKGGSREEDEDEEDEEDEEEEAEVKRGKEELECEV